MAFQNKRKRLRINPVHRWKEAETVNLLTMVAKAVQNNSEFEKPTAQKFYEKITSKSSILGNIDWRVMKAKMRYLKGTYLSALQHLNKAGLNIVDEENVAETVKKICPNWNLLEIIFGQFLSLNQRPVLEAYTISSVEDSNDNRSKCSMKVEWTGEQGEVDESDDEQISAENSGTNTPEEFDTSEEVIPNPPYEKQTQQVRNKEKNKLNPLALLLSIQEKRLELEFKKFELEKEKVQNQVEMKKMELKKELEIRKLELEKEERIEKEKIRLQFETEEKIKKYEIDMASKKN